MRNDKIINDLRNSKSNKIQLMYVKKLMDLGFVYGGIDPLDKIFGIIMNKNNFHIKIHSDKIIIYRLDGPNRNTILFNDPNSFNHLDSLLVK